MTGEKILFRVIGKVKVERGYTLSELLTLDAFETQEQLHACGSGDPKGHLPPCRGVRLTDVINGAEVITAGHNDTKKMYLVAKAEDGYSTLFSWQELFNTSVGEGVMVILEKNGQKLFENPGRIDLFSSYDILTGPRYVKNLKSLEIVLIEP